MSIVFLDGNHPFLVTCHRKIVHGLCRCQYIPGTQMTVVLNGVWAFFLRVEAPT